MAKNLNVSKNKFGDNTVVVQGNNYAPISAGSLRNGDSWLEAISETDPIDDKNRILELKGRFLYESFCWILDHEDFNRWRNTEKSGVFWIKGDPGKGKTMLLGGIVNHVEENPGNTNLTYFFCQATDSRINTATAIIGGLIFSFIKQRQKLRQYIASEYKDNLCQLNGPNRWNILCRMFEDVTQHSTLPYPVCVVDALDECEHEHGRKELLRLIIKTSCRNKSPIKWLISSRNSAEIERELQAIESNRRLSLELKENAEYVTESVNLYINHSIRDIVALQGDEELQIRVTDTLKDKAKGTFLWVALVFEKLRETKHRNIKKVLEEMPEGLENLYNLILQQLAKQEDIDGYQILLSIVTAAERPLRLEELGVFIRSQWKNDGTTDDLRDIRDMVKDCGSFLTIQDNTVYFIHQSVKDYIMGTASKIILPSGIEYQHYKMFTTSLNAMSRILKHDIYNLQNPGSDIKTISPPSPDPLAPIAYCCIFWVEHLFRICEPGASRNEVFLKDGGILHSFLKVKYLCWLESLALLHCLVPQGMDAIQKLKNILSGHDKSEANRRHVDEMANPQEQRNANRLKLFIHNANQIIRRFNDLYLVTYINYAYTFFYYHDDSRLRSFINDAYHFSHYYKDCVRKYPLQLYYSAVLFEDTHSAIYTTFQQIIRAEFKNSLTFIKRPPRQFSLVSNIELNLNGFTKALLYSPDSAFLCSLSFGDTISLFRTDSCTLERVIKVGVDGHHWHGFMIGGQHNFLAFSIDSKHLVSISISGIVHVWAVNCGIQIQKFSLNLNTNFVPRPERFHLGRHDILQEEVIALSKYGNLAASTCRTLSGTVSSVKIWTIDAGKCTCLYVIEQSRMLDFVDTVFSPNLSMLVLINEKDATVYSVQTGKEIKHIKHPAAIVNTFANGMIYPQFSADSKLLVFKYADGDTRLWCTKTWTTIRRIRSKHPTRLFDLSPDAAVSVRGGGHTLLLESMDSGEPLINIKSHVRIYNPIFSPDWTDSSLLASFSDRAVQIWRAHVNTRDKSSEIQDTGSYGDVVISPKATFVAARDYEGNIVIWSRESGKCIQVLKGNASRCSSPVFSPNQELVACAQENGGDVQIWDVETGKSLHLLKGPDAECPRVCMAISDDSGYMVVGYHTGHVKLWCLESGKCLYETLWCNGHDKARNSRVAFSHDSKYIASAADGTFASGSVPPTTVCIWDWRTRRCISRIELKLWSEVKSLTFSSDATVLVIITKTSSATASHSYKAEFYDVADNACLGYIDISESNCSPLYDLAKDHIVSDRLRFCKRSSWKHWDKIPQPRYSYLATGSSLQKDKWIYFGEQKLFQVPRHYSDAYDMQISDSLLIMRNNAGEVIMIQLPSQYDVCQ